MKTAAELYDMLKPIQEKKGYYFNRDTGLVMKLLQGLLLNRERYGYMSCPCRLASGSRDNDSDIICPCVYREADVREYGSCYCALYVSAEWNEGLPDHVYVPERRPADRTLPA
ncbi:MAG: ferredoxin:thioredoxin reductase [Syntrophales bacterium]|jgi:ferredoxin-thioredoxin reductase catalytic subunit|nr:ferredoxin:thioredoxin reductase [Syntrophales bacterium]MCK9528419.1 ferredoxin:thioredoxin reductase [Syntrophales bacterium]MDX9922442.1 ferredoxin-thioredoxin reductase catalytic domain-containing protein [Syntrophales bacterium]